MRCKVSTVAISALLISAPLHSQHVGINTTTPAVELDIRTLSNDDGSDISLSNLDQSHFLRLFSGRQNYPSPIIYWQDGDPLLFGTNLNLFSERLRITSQGNIGIGTTMPINRLDIKSDGVADTTSTVLALISDVSNRPVLQFSEWETGLAGSGMSIEYNGADSVNPLHIRNVAGQRKFTFTSFGNMGIGVTAPNEILEIGGSGRFFIGNGAGSSRKGLLIAAVNAGNFVRLHPYNYGTATDMYLYIPSTVTIGKEVGASGYMLSVNGKVIAEEMRIQLDSAWPDYVFDEAYPLPDLKELERSIQLYKHLPGIPSALDIKEDGVLIGDMQARMMQKIEELTLYIIQQHKEIEQLKMAVNALTNKKARR